MGGDANHAQTRPGSPGAKPAGALEQRMFHAGRDSITDSSPQTNLRARASPKGAGGRFVRTAAPRTIPRKPASMFAVVTKRSQSGPSEGHSPPPPLTRSAVAGHPWTGRAAADTIATIRSRATSGSVGQAATTAARSGSAGVGGGAGRGLSEPESLSGAPDSAPPSCRIGPPEPGSAQVRVLLRPFPVGDVCRWLAAGGLGRGGRYPDSISCSGASCERSSGVVREHLVSP